MVRGAHSRAVELHALYKPIAPGTMSTVHLIAYSSFPNENTVGLQYVTSFGVCKHVFPRDQRETEVIQP
jgi:hypothetical protein